ncbi:type II secretion system protein [Acetobacterium wieringae]|uniref:type II secretion system protein n=1 Tax=Acetobacterium wieringae TaxID=52694 RepID=UPI00315937DF
MELINRIRKKDKGFTLVEIIVVLVILAILAAFTIPTMLGFVNDAKGKALIAEAREVYVAAQATATEYNGASAASLGSDAVEAQHTSPAGTATISTKASTQMYTYLNNDVTISNSATKPTSADSAAFWEVTLNGTNTSKVDTVVYSRNGYTVTINKTGTGTDGATIVKYV